MMEDVPRGCPLRSTLAGGDCLDLAVGIDVGFSEAKRSTGVAIVERATRQVAPGSSIIVDTAVAASAYLDSELSRLQPRSATFGVDGPFAPATSGSKVRHVERFFMSGPFASSAMPGLRLSPAPTGHNSVFLRQTRAVLAVIAKNGYAISRFIGTALVGAAIEIFPTLYMASLLPPHPYSGSRSQHTDDLWNRLTVSSLHPFLVPYLQVISAAAALPRSLQHDASMAALCAIAADVTAANPVGTSKGAATFIGEPAEHGFILPPRTCVDSQFAAMLTQHWNSRGGPPLWWA
jgi:hypothetical protein